MKKRNIQVEHFTVYALFFCFMFILHVPMGFVADDYVVSATIQNESLFAFFLNRFFSNGRIFTDVLANAFYRMPLLVWKVFDTLLYVALVKLLVFLFSKETTVHILITCFLVLLYPFEYLVSAGYIATTTNYIYPIFCLLVIAVPFRKYYLGQKIAIGNHIASLLAILYSTNHDQSAMVLIGGLFLALVLSQYLKMDRELVHLIRIYLLAALVSYGLMFIMPGHINRMNSTWELEYWFPGYAQWTLTDKIYHGYTSTVANLIFGEIKLFWVFCILLAMLSLQKTMWINRLVSFVPLCIMIFSEQIGIEYFITYLDYTQGMPELIPLDGRLLHYIPLIFSLITVCAIFLSILLLVKDRSRKCLLISLLTLAAGSREMMGFSATIYASSYRTFSIFLYVLIICCLILLNEISDRVDIRIK